MKAWWTQRSPRERLLISIAALAGLAVLFYALIWQPLLSQRKVLQQSVLQLRNDLAWMQQAAAEVQRLKQSQPQRTASASASSSTPSLPTLIDQSARASGLGSSLKRVEPQANQQLQIQFERVGFDQMLHWLNDLQQEHSIVIVNAVINRQETSGQVNARLTLQGTDS